LNIYKHQYSTLKEKLFEFGKTIGSYRYDDRYWKSAALKSKKNAPGSWESVFSDYIYRCCNEEDRKFIALYFFKKESVIAVSGGIHLSERGCQEWREEILKNLGGLAVQAGLLYINTTNCNLKCHCGTYFGIRLFTIVRNNHQKCHIFT